MISLCEQLDNSAPKRVGRKAELPTYARLPAPSSTVRAERHQEKPIFMPASTNLPQNLPLTTGPSKKDVSFLQHPGVYEIWDSVNNKSYYGESASLMHRLDIHRQQIEKGCHENTLLDKALKSNLSKDKVQFFVLDSGPEWSVASNRIARQDAYVASNAERCYNYDVDADVSERVIRPLMAHGVRYQSVRAAERAGIGSRASIKRYLTDPNNKDFVFLPNEEQKYGEIAIFGKKGNSPSILFQSYTECVQAGFATTKQNARRKIDRGDDGWRYAHVDASGKPIRTPYTLKTGEISYKQWKETQ